MHSKVICRNWVLGWGLRRGDSANEAEYDNRDEPHYLKDRNQGFDLPFSTGKPCLTHPGNRGNK
jgi:hypothetical protein